MQFNQDVEPTIIKRRTGGRSARVKNAVLEQALLELIENGYIGFSIAAVAKHAQVHETTIYRRLSTKEELIIDAIRYFGNVQLEIANTGDLAKDLEHNLKNIAQVLQSPIGRALVQLSLSSSQLPDIQRIIRQLWQERIHMGQQVFEFAIARGEWPKDYNKEYVFSLLIGPLMTHHLLLQQPITNEMIQLQIQAILSQRDHLNLDPELCN